MKEDGRLKEGLYSNNFVKDLLMLEILQNTDAENPKTARQIADEIEKLWHENENLKNIPFNSKDKSESDKVSATITRHIHDLNKSGLYDIKTCDEKKKGYYNGKVKNFISDTAEPVSKKIDENFIFSAAEFAVIAMALYRTPSISTEETQQILNKFKNLMAPEGESFNYFLQKQIEYWKGIRRKPARKILPIISKLLNAILEEKLIKFKLYKNSFEFQQELQKSREGGVRDKIFTVSPHFFVWDNDECYLVASEYLSDKYKNFYERNLLHFKISLIEDLKILDERVEPLMTHSEYARYTPGVNRFYRSLGDEYVWTLEDIRGLVTRYVNGELLKYEDLKKIKRFSLDRYMRDHIYMEQNNTPVISIAILFKEDFLDKFLTQFGSNQEFRQAKKEDEYLSIITVQENDGLYRWLMQYFDQVKVIRPLKIREELRFRYEEALENLNL